ncbi:hypothetical protein JHK82_017010 [Glycine max]|nr:hypothetical protein JHK82_017010 [Glycine max]
MTEETNIGEPLLKKQYYENCPGCKVDRAKELEKDVSIRNLVHIWIVVLCGALPVSSLYPFLYFMVKDFNIAEGEEDISAYAGYIGSAFMLGRCLTSMLWGMIADRYGRKPVVIISVISVVIFNILFGLSTSFWMAVITRLFLGCLNGVMGTIKAFSSEIFREEYQPLGLSTVSAAWGVGLALGPALGGYLAQPVEKYPYLFSKGSFWDRFPYFLPCLVISTFAFSVAIACIWLPETNHNHNPEALEIRSRAPDKDKVVQNNESVFRNWPLMSSIIVYCVFSLHDNAYSEVFSLWAVSPRWLGGLNFTTNSVGNVLVVSGFAIIIFQLGLYQSIQKTCGPVNLARISGVLSIPILQSYPFMTMLSGFTLYAAIYIASILNNVIIEIITTCLLILQNRAVEQQQRGIANGISMTAMSAFKVIGPAAGGAILTSSQKRLNATFLPGTHLIFFSLNVVEGLGVLLTFKPFLTIKKLPLELLK